MLWLLPASVPIVEINRKGHHQVAHAQLAERTRERPFLQLSYGLSAATFLQFLQQPSISVPLWVDIQPTDWEGDHTVSF